MAGNDMTEIPSAEIARFLDKDVRGVHFRRLVDHALSAGLLFEAVQGTSRSAHQVSLGPISILVIGPVCRDPQQKARHIQRRSLPALLALGLIEAVAAWRPLQFMKVIYHALHSTSST
jgi:hypothetical protein